MDSKQSNEQSEACKHGSSPNEWKLTIWGDQAQARKKISNQGLDTTKRALQRDELTSAMRSRRGPKSFEKLLNRHLILGTFPSNFKRLGRRELTKFVWSRVDVRVCDSSTSKGRHISIREKCIPAIWLQTVWERR